MIELDDVHKSFHGNHVLRGLSFKITPGELVGLIGPNGAGKSTALSIVTGQLLADAGVASLGGHDIVHEPLLARKSLGYVPQESGVEPFLTGEEVLQFVANLREVEDSSNQIEQLLSQFSLLDARRRLTREYSEGMTRRLAIAAALLPKPPALIFDESLNGLDPRGARLVRGALRERAAAGAAILITGHVLETMERLCTRILLLHEGRITRDISEAELTECRETGVSLEQLYLDSTA
ncbi:MAG: ABC transporter ATP-binding protein [Myxococcota bacterium]|nr:ABC transporter ATP-binding protein [Myxococcota bacterium]